ncbi:hypothetical protein BD626DRAFT_492214 [Schizophyllum amplum]|uniref:Dickkopf N-terminal cysteine-rich domain-containing protein n=1 Tax=Schizophyllum amplum TaxID=97359 RepID=A0A550CID5_9AGAR|nr:hypothetical protein BD626DRAFT_492214 [Auriculariopsis ampla]
MIVSTYAPILLALGVLGGSVGHGGHCSTENDHLDMFTHKFMSDCTDSAFCTAPNGTCEARNCRRDEYPFGYSVDTSLPPLCAHGSFCPDEGDGCRVLVPLGGPCQLERDEQCSEPENWMELASPYNANGSICIQSTCMYANATLGQTCVTDNTTYVELGPDGNPYTIVVSRDNCRTPYFYCDATQGVCSRSLPWGSPCSADRECEQHNCVTGICADSPETPLRVPAWQCALTILSILGAMAATCIFLTIVHKRQRFEQYTELRDYYYEQMSYRNDIIALHAAAADKITREKGAHAPR